MRRGLTRILLLVVLLTGAMLVACSSDDDEGGGSSNGEATATATENGGNGGDDLDEELVKQGRTVSAAQCWACHSQDGAASVGPTWLGLFGKTETLDDGSTVEVDEAYLRESITDPGAKVVQGFAAGTMPQFATLSDDDLNAIVAYIKSLGE